MKHYALATVLLLCGIGLTTSCGVEDTPAEPEPSAEEQEATANRDELVRHMENDAKTLSEKFNAASLSATSQAYSQLQALLLRDKTFIKNMRTLFSTYAEKKSLLNLYPVEAGSELAKMGYLAYIAVDNGGFGVQIIFDGKGGSRLLSADHLEFIFPANISGFGPTLCKLIINESDDCYQSVSTFNDLKRLACINRLPKQITMTLNGFIDNRELTLSESVISLELPKKDSEYVDFDDPTCKIVGKQSFYLNADDKSTLDFCLSMDKDDMTLGYNYACDGASVVDCEAQMQPTQQGGFLGLMSTSALNVVDIKTFTIRMLDDLTLSGTITDGASFAGDFPTAIKNRQQVSSPDVLAGIVESLNESCHLQLSCEQMTKPENVGFCVVQKDKMYMIEPALKDLKSGDYIPMSQIVDAQTMANFNMPFNLSFTPGGNATSSTLNVYSALLQMMPLTK